MSLPYLELAREAILVTFGYRHGLLGFLPLSGADSATAPNLETTRSNHAIWDQVALLHWLRHNVIHFGGDPGNISLQAVDNKAAQLLQMLAFSPMVKGLFQRLILVRDERFISADSLTRLGGGSPSEARDSRMRLNSALRQAVTLVSSGAYPNEIASSDVLDFLQSANMTQLAQMESHLRQLLPAKVLALALGPSMDDKHLFPYFSTLVKQLDLFQPQPTTLAHINYLLYVRHLRSHPTDDELKLLQAGRSLVNGSSENQGLLVGWYRSSNLSSEIHEEDSPSYTSRQRDNLATIAGLFHHLRSLNLLVRLMSFTSNTEKGSPFVHYQQEVDNSMHVCSFREQAQNFDSQIASFDLLIGHYLQTRVDTLQEQQLFNGTFSNIINTLLENFTIFKQEMLIWLKFSDLHSLASLMASCDKLLNPETNNRPSSTYVFFSRHASNEDESVNWLKDALEQRTLFQSLSSFIASGTPNFTGWPPYNSLERGSEKFALTDEEMGSIRYQISLFLDLVPYLSQTATEWRQHGDLFSCLVELNSTIGVGKTDPNQVHIPKCLLSKMDKLRAAIRQLAYQELDSIQQTLKTHQETSMNTRNVALDDNLLMDSEIMSSEFVSMTGSMDPSEVRPAKFKHLQRNAYVEETGVVGSIINFVRQRPLMVVVTTGLVIFFVNLVIVLVIAVRTRKKRRVVDSAVQQPETSVQLSNDKPSNQCAVKRLTFELPEVTNPNLCNPQLMLVEPSSPNNYVHVQDHEGFLVGSSFASQSTYSNNSATSVHPLPTISANTLGSIFHSPCTSNDTCTLTPIQNSLFEANSPYQEKYIPTNQFASNEISEMLLCTTNRHQPPDEQQNSSELLILAPYPNHYFMNQQL